MMLSRLFCAALQCCSISRVFGVGNTMTSISHADLRQKTRLPAPPLHATKLALPFLRAAKLPPSVSPRNLRPWHSQTETILGDGRRPRVVRGCVEQQAFALVVERYLGTLSSALPARTPCHQRNVRTRRTSAKSTATGAT